MPSKDIVTSVSNLTVEENLASDTLLVTWVLDTIHYNCEEQKALCGYAGKIFTRKCTR